MLKGVANIFSKSRKDRINTIEVSKYENEDSLVLANYTGLYTIKNINDPNTSDDLFYFHPGRNVIQGYVDANGAKSINLIDKRKKLVKSVCNSFYHSILDDFSEILYAMEQYPDYDILIDTSELALGLEEDPRNWDFFTFFVECLRREKKTVNLVNLKHYDVIYLNDFRVVSYIYESGKKTSLVYDLYKKYVDNPDTIPTKNVLVSRAQASLRPTLDSNTLSYRDDTRLDDHDALERYFATLGYEIIHAENFPSFKEQLNYFYSAKTIVSITGSGLTNAAFMQPGSTMVEIVTPLVVSVPPPDRPKDLTKPFYVQELHNFYKNLAYYQGHIFAALQNPNRSFEELKNTIESDKKLKAFLDRND